MEPRTVLLVLLALALVCAALFMTLGARGNWGFVLSFRGTKLLALGLVGWAIAMSTVLFQTATDNRILTPSIMGFDALYILLQTLIVFFFGALSLSTFDPTLMFVLEVLALSLFAGALFRTLFSGAIRSLHLLVLVGIVAGVLFRSLTNFIQRLIDPNEFVVLQDRFFASFNTFNAGLLPIAALLVGGASVLVWRMRWKLDVLALGRETAINLGLDHKRTITEVLALVTVLVAVSTALVGPVTFLGLLVANLAYLLIPSHKHALILPAAGLIAIVTLVGGQTLLERVFAFDTSLSIVIEFIGGITFIILLLRGATR
jgi:iron complex transport system permease protein